MVQRRTLYEALSTLYEALREVDDEYVTVMFVTPDGVQYTLGRFEVCGGETGDERVVVDLTRDVGSDGEETKHG
jgi:hypothetical protein